MQPMRPASSFLQLSYDLPCVSPAERQMRQIDMAKRQLTAKRRERATTRRRFSAETLKALTDAKILGVRAGNEHRYTGIWVVVVERRVFARSWNNKPTGWFRAFSVQPLGSIRFGDREVKVRASRVRSARLRDAVSAAYALKYNTKASQKWVDGFAEPERSVHTVEFTPA